MKMMPPDVLSHENQLQHLSEPWIFILDVFRTADHAGQIFIPHRIWPAGRNLETPEVQLYNVKEFILEEWLLMGKTVADKVLHLNIEVAPNQHLAFYIKIVS